MFYEGPIAQLAEPPAHNRSVPGSNPGGPTILWFYDNKQGAVMVIPRLFYSAFKNLVLRARSEKIGYAVVAARRLFRL